MQVIINGNLFSELLETALTSQIYPYGILINKLKKFYLNIIFILSLI